MLLHVQATNHANSKDQCVITGQPNWSSWH